MSATYDLFTRWKAANGYDSDNAGAIALGITRGTASLWKSGRNANVDLIERMAKDLGESPAAWAALVMKEQSQGEAARTWARIARQLGAAAAVALYAVALPLTTSAGAVEQGARYLGLYIM